MQITIQEAVSLRMKNYNITHRSALIHETKAMAKRQEQCVVANYFGVAANASPPPSPRTNTRGRMENQRSFFPAARQRSRSHDAQ